jgi:hypothetical protein
MNAVISNCTQLMVTSCSELLAVWPYKMYGKMWNKPKCPVHMHFLKFNAVWEGNPHSITEGNFLISCLYITCSMKILQRACGWASTILKVKYQTCSIHIFEHNFRNIILLNSILQYICVNVGELYVQISVWWICNCNSLLFNFWSNEYFKLWSICFG